MIMIAELSLCTHKNDVKIKKKTFKHVNYCFIYLFNNLFIIVALDTVARQLVFLGIARKCGLQNRLKSILSRIVMQSTSYSFSIFVFLFSSSSCNICACSKLCRAALD